MPDRDLRELERNAHGGDPDAQAKLLAELIRRGLLQPERARVALLLGHGTRGDAPAPTGWAWLAALVESGPEAALRTALAAARHVQPVWEDANRDDDRFERALEACEAWLLDPTAETRAAAVAAALRLPDPSPISYPPNRASRTIRFLGRAIETEDAERRTEYLRDSLRFAQQTSAGEALRQAISEILLPWAVRTERP